MCYKTKYSKQVIKPIKTQDFQQLKVRFLLNKHAFFYFRRAKKFKKAPKKAFSNSKSRYFSKF